MNSLPNKPVKSLSDRNSDDNDIAKLMKLVNCDMDKGKIFENNVDLFPNNFFRAMVQTLQPRLPAASILTDSNMLKDISNRIAGSNGNSNRRMIRSNSEYSQHSFINKIASSSSNCINIVKPRVLAGNQLRTDVENSAARYASLFSIREGVIQVSLRDGIKIDITVDNCIRLTSSAGQIVISLSKTGETSSLKHPNGMMEQYGKFVQIIANSGRECNSTRYANMNTNGISFTSSNLDNVFILDTIGTRESKEYFAKLNGDNTSTVFLSKAQLVSTFNDENINIIQKASYKKNTDDGTEVITINDYRIWQMKDGLVTVARISYPFKIRASPKNCSLTLSTPHVHCTASSRDSPHLFVRCQDQSMHFDGSNFVVRYNGNSAGFDKHDHLIVY